MMKILISSLSKYSVPIGHLYREKPKVVPLRKGIIIYACAVQQANTLQIPTMKFIYIKF